MLELHHVTVRYDRGDAQPALSDIDLSVDDGEVVCVLGPSGSGKSTLLRAIAGLEPLEAGTITRDGIDLAGIPTSRRAVGLMFQHHALFSHRDVLANVSFGPRMHRSKDPAERARTSLEFVGLAGFETRRVSELSGGEAQRVSLARALAASPKLLMLDEPLGSLDRELRDRLAADLRTLFERLDIGVLFVTHDHDEAFAIADRIVVLRAGRLQQVATPRELWRRPANAFVARFLGWEVTNAFGGRHAVRPGGLFIAGSHQAVSPAGSRPGRDRDTPASVGATVGSRTFRRDHFLVTVHLDDGSTLRVGVDPDHLPEPGSTVHVGAGADALVPVEEQPA